METLKKISVVNVSLFLWSIFIVIAFAIFSPSPDDNEKSARIACMAETQMRFGNDIVYGNMPSDRVILPNGDNKFTVRLRFRNKYDVVRTVIETVVCDVHKNGDEYKTVSFNVHTVRTID